MLPPDAAAAACRPSRMLPAAEPVSGRLTNALSRPAEPCRPGRLAPARQRSAACRPSRRGAIRATSAAPRAGTAACASAATTRRHAAERAPWTTSPPSPLSRLVAQQRAHGRDRRQHRQRQHARLQGRAHAVQRLARARQPRPASRRGGDDHRLHAGPRHLARPHAGRAARTPAIRSTSRSPATAASPSCTPSGPRLTRDGRFGSDARRHHRRRAPATRCSTANGQPIAASPPADTQADRSPATARSSSENGQIGKIGVVQAAAIRCSCSAEGGTLFARRHAHHAGAPRRRSCRARSRNRNVQPVLELTRMMDDMRAFQFVDADASRPRADRQAGAIDKMLPRKRGASRCARSISPAPGCRRSRPTSR